MQSKHVSIEEVGKMGRGVYVGSVGNLILSFSFLFRFVFVFVFVVGVGVGNCQTDGYITYMCVVVWVVLR